MWKKILPLLVVLSVALNIAFAGTWAAHAVRWPWPMSPSDEDQLIWCPLHRQLGVTIKQWKELEPQVRAFHAHTNEIHDRLDRLRDEMIESIADVDPDPARIDAVKEGIRAAQQEIQDHVVDHLLAQKTILTAEQQDMLLTMMRERSACGRRSRMRGFSGGGRYPYTGNNGDLPGQEQ